MDGRTVVVVAGGRAPAHAALPADATVIAADSGLGVALELGLAVDIVVGDLDSVDPQRLEQATASGTRVERHPVAKDATDLELAMAAAVELHPRRIVVVGGYGGRLDHLLGNVALLASPRWEGVEVSALLGGGSIHVVRRELSLRGAPGEFLSVTPVNGAATVSIEGLRYAADHLELSPGSSRGISNEFVEAAAKVRVHTGTVLVIQPGG